MKFLSIYLSNYIGIYNGMGLYEIHIDMSRCRNRITIIRGDNGSGKSTLSKAMSLFPDPNDAFIPGMEARKEIILADKEIIYKLCFIHGVNNNGERQTTKAYISTGFSGHFVELHENGNVSSYKDILYEELGLDNNFAALSQLSNDDRGLADKKPAERKRFVNSIISSLDSYNNIYKTLSKKSNSFKSMINTIIAKLNVLGDEKTLENSLETVEERINTLQDMKDKYVTDLAKNQSKISLLDPDGMIQNTNIEISSAINREEKELNKILEQIKELYRRHGLGSIDPENENSIITERIKSITVKNQIIASDIQSLISQRESKSEQLFEKQRRVSSIKSDKTLTDILAQITKYSNDISEIEARFKNTIGLENIDSISKDEYILALESIKYIDSAIQSFKEATDLKTMEDIIGYYLYNGTIPQVRECEAARKESEEKKKELNEKEKEMVLLSSQMGLLDKLSFRPSDCTNDYCSFIKEALEFSKTKPKERMDGIMSLISALEQNIYELGNSIDISMKFNESVNRFSILIREIEKNRAVLVKMPNGEMFENKKLFLQRLMSGYSFEYMRSIYNYIDLANLLDIYNTSKSILESLNSERAILESKNITINAFNEDIDNLCEEIRDIDTKLRTAREEIENNNLEIQRYKEKKSVMESLIEINKSKLEISSKICDLKVKQQENNKKMEQINEALSSSIFSQKQIEQLTYQISPLMKERDKLIHSVQMMKDYIRERDELQRSYEFIETLKYYSSPTTGIQLVFMELYMGKIIALANDLLSLLFSGKFQIQPFIINESEFRIPCLGDGYINDDISSMSSSQIGMISMILSFALLHHSSTKYNIIKLDEIDGPLDYNNRLFFIDVLTKIMDIMGTEQCIMISHNAELQVDDSDVILLRHDTNNNDFRRGNIIWSY